jgi:hypothetical protein
VPFQGLRIDILNPIYVYSFSSKGDGLQHVIAGKTVAAMLQDSKIAGHTNGGLSGTYTNQCIQSSWSANMGLARAKQSKAPQPQPKHEEAL